MRVEYWLVIQLGDRPRRTWKEAVVRWLEETAHKRTQCDDIAHLRWADRFLGARMLDEINRELLDRLAAAKKVSGVSNATVNRQMEVVRAILNRAVREWEWLDKALVVRMLPEPKRRIRWITHEEADRLLDELPPQLRVMAQFSLATGLRQANVTGLEWSQVDLGRRVAWVHADQAKAGTPIGVPLNAEAVVVLREQLVLTCVS